MTREAEPAHRHTKSRNGCLTCKARRRKCDEAKPSCAQCARRRVTCGGYSKGLRWKEVGQPGRKSRAGGLTRTAAAGGGGGSSSSSSRDGNADVGGESGNAAAGQTVGQLDDRLLPAETMQPLVDMDQLLADIHAALQGSSSLGTAGPPLPPLPPLLPSFFGPGQADVVPEMPASLHSSMEVPLGMDLEPAGPPEPEPGLRGYGAGIDIDIDIRDDDDDHDGHGSAEAATGWQMPFEAVASVSTSPSSSSSASSSSSSSPSSSPSPLLCQHPRFHPGSPEHIAFLFHRRICEVLCIRDDGAAGNPWRRIVWPLAQDHAALYHAVAAMTCFQGGASRHLPHFRADGLRHLNTSIQQMESSSPEGAPMRLEVALAVTLVLGFAQTWYYPRSSTGIRFVKSAKRLLQKALDRHTSSSSPSLDLACLRFLANTWVYMDVISRFTCRGVQTVDTRFMAAWRRRLDPEPQPQPGRQGRGHRLLRVDPLMGIAATLFPLIGRVADLVSRVHSRSFVSSGRDDDDLNPPGLVAEAVELRQSVERWSPADADADDLPEPASGLQHHHLPPSSTATPSPSDLVQTANAYKWAALLLLLQAVPELPRSRAQSPARLARRVLVLLATVPLGSRAVIFPVLPLLIAGCEADDPGDRRWVRRRWHALATGNSSGIVDRCVEITLEVWRRRDSAREADSPPWTQHNPDIPCGIPGGILGGIPGGILDIPDIPDIPDDPDPFSLPPWPAVPNSLPYESLQPVAPTPALTEFTVKSRQHWLSVMRDWGWEVMLG